MDLEQSSAQGFVVPEAANDPCDRHLPLKKILSSSLIFPLIFLSVKSRPRLRHRPPVAAPLAVVRRRHRRLVRSVRVALTTEGFRGA